MKLPGSFYSRFPSAVRSGMRLAISSILAASLLSVPLWSQKNSDELRAVHGTVIGKTEDPLPGAVVYLENVHTQTVRTYISDSAGDYRFTGLDPNVDYEMHAEHGDQVSGNHTISSFDTRKDIVVSLKVDKEKKKNEK